jgi:hypothetical protein
MSIDELNYSGAFRIPAAVAGESSPGSAAGPIAFNPQNKSLFIIGHSHQMALAEYAIPLLSTSTDLTQLPLAPSPLQPFSKILTRVAGGNPQELDGFGGMITIPTDHGYQLFVNAVEYYDAPANNTQALLVVREPNTIAQSRIDGFYEYDTLTGHRCGWLSPIPAVWRDTLGGPFLIGHSSGMPILSRLPVGVTAFACNPLDASIQPQPQKKLTTVTLMDFSLEHKLHDDLANESLTNDLWTHLSRVTYGLIVPGTRTYATFGYSGGHSSGVCYKCTQTNGAQCPGFCENNPEDYYPYYWLWDVYDFIKVRQGELKPYELRPYEYGIFNTPFTSPHHPKIGGGTFDEEAGILYLSLSGADTSQGIYERPPVIIAYKLKP